VRVSVVIPALNEAGNIGDLVAETFAQGVSEVIVADNGSTDGTGRAAQDAGAAVVVEPRRGYGYACAAGAAAAGAAAAGAGAARSDVIVFMDGDYSSLPRELDRLLAPLAEGRADLVLGSRMLGHIAPGAMPAHQRTGNWLMSAVMRRLYRVAVTDLGPYRAIRRELLAGLDMREMTFGWPVEMMVKAARHGARIVEVPVSFLPRRSGRSKVSGTVAGSFLAAYHIITVILRYAVARH
jgi:glycosyltransferase involved in cell wall biosynthesis